VFIIVFHERKHHLKKVQLVQQACGGASVINQWAANLHRIFHTLGIPVGGGLGQDL
jgi:hypothetical protein